jgi:hypothetical protein
MSTPLKDLIEAARTIEITPEMAREQRQSFVFGNVSMHNPDVTRELVAEVDAELQNNEASKGPQL